MVFLSGITWTFGLLYLVWETLFTAYLFSITNSFQALFIFFFNCLYNEKVRTEYRKLFSSINFKPICLDSSPSKSIDTTREQMPSSSLTPEQRTSLYVNNSNHNSNPKEVQSIVNVFPNHNVVNCEPLIGGTSNAPNNGLNMGSLMASTDSPRMRRLNQKYYLTDDSDNDNGCERLPIKRCQKHSRRDLCVLNEKIMSSHFSHSIEHINL